MEESALNISKGWGPSLLSKRIWGSKHSWLYVVLFSVMALIASRLILCLLCHMQDPEVDFVSKMCSIWDNNWYYGVIYDGYPNEPTGHAEGNAAAWAFFPLDAILIRIFSINGRFDYRTTGFILNNLFFLAGVLASYKYILLTRKDANLALIYILLMSFGPYCFYFSCLYTESLFMLLTICVFIEMQQEHYIRMGIFGLLLSGCRATGIFVVFSVLIFIIKKHISKKSRFLEFLKDTMTNKSLLIGTCMIPAGLFLYMFYLYKLTGDSLAFAHIELAWGREAKAFELIPFIGKSLLSTEFVDVYEVAVLFIVIVTLIFHVKRYLHETILYIVPVVLQFFSPSLLGVARYSIGTGVFVIAFVEMLKTHLSKTAQIVVYAFLLMLSFILSMSWFMRRPITIG